MKPIIILWGIPCLNCTGPGLELSNSHQPFHLTDSKKTVTYHHIKLMFQVLLPLLQLHFPFFQLALLQAQVALRPLQPLQSGLDLLSTTTVLEPSQ